MVALGKEAGEAAVERELVVGLAAQRRLFLLLVHRMMGGRGMMVEAAERDASATRDGPYVGSRPACASCVGREGGW